MSTHASQDDSFYKQCSVCGRKSYEDVYHEAICWMTQPNGSRCQGVLRGPIASQSANACVKP